jgi:Rieske 2Fe-2S family protein
MSKWAAPVWSSTRYTSKDDFELECRRIFEREWMCVAHSSELRDPGSFIRVEIGGESALVVRNRDGELRGLLNLCQHRGARLCLDDRGKLGRSIQCMYHGWTYDLNGRLVGVPFRDQFPPGATENRHLPTVAVGEWLGYIWVNLSGDAPPLADHLEPEIKARFGENFNPIPNYGTEDLQIVHSVTYDVQANWKLIWENFHECYHCPTMHRELCAAIPEFRDGYGTVTGPEALAQGLGAQLADNAAGFSMSGRAVAPTLPGVPEEDKRTFYGCYLWPAVRVDFIPDHVYFMRFEPLGPDHTRLVADWLFHPDAVARPGFDPEDAIKVFDITNQQDFEACERMQLGAKSRFYDDAQVFAPHEYLIEGLRRRVDEALADADSADMTPEPQAEALAA